MWMSRFTGSPKPAQPNIPASVDEGGEWATWLSNDWRWSREDHRSTAAGLTDEVLAGDLSWFSGAIQADVTAAWATCDAFLQSPNPPPRPGSFHADGSGGDAG